MYFASNIFYKDNDIQLNIYNIAVKVFFLIFCYWIEGLTLSNNV